jgi:Response regulators consisting of a CheY-like receiver domain and a winged-helix DNA-binding domain
LFLVKQNLNEEGKYEVEYTNDPDEGIKLAKRIVPDVILLDITMPKKTGLEVLEILKKDKKTVGLPVIMLTALQDTETKLKASYLYGDDYLVKPITLGLLKIKIDEVIERSSRLHKK